MSTTKFIFQSLLHYRKAHLTVVLGVAVSAMVLTGTLIVGDSVEYSLEKTAEFRLGDIDYTFSGIDRYFRSNLAVELQNDLNAPVSAIIQVKGIASSQGGKFKMNNIDVHGIDQGFLKMIPKTPIGNLPDRNEAYISRNLAQRLQLKEGDSFVLRIEKVSTIPKNAPFVSDEENQISLRLKVARILDIGELGRFNLKTSQTAPYNVFLSLDFLNDRMDMQNKANRILISTESDIDRQSIPEIIKDHWKLIDSGLTVESVNDNSEWSLESERVFIDSAVVVAVERVVPEVKEVLTYFVNSIQKGSKSTPYSFVSAISSIDELEDFQSNEIIINEWLASDLNAGVGDSLKLTYYVIGPLRKLIEQYSWFIVKDIVPLTGKFGDPSLMPTLPGLSDAGSCSDWETGIPIDLDRIRDKDELYWNEWKGTPKAFISYNTGRELWENRFGNCTALRTNAGTNDIEAFIAELEEEISPENLGFRISAVREEGMKAARGGVDFAQLFFGMSFFLLLAGLTLIAMLFNIQLERRMNQVGTLKAIGFSNRLIHRLFLLEETWVALFGVIMGSLLAIWYNKLIFKALNTLWSDIVRTTVLTEDIRVSTLATGALISLVLAELTIHFNLRRKLKLSPLKLQRSQTLLTRLSSKKWTRGLGWASATIALIMLGRELILKSELNAGVFFASGGLLLLAALLFTLDLLTREKKVSGHTLSYANLAIKNLQRNRARSLRIVILFALGTFVIVSTGLNQKDLYSEADSLDSGTGGFSFFAESTMPMLHDLNDPENRSRYGIDAPLDFIQIRVSEGDDASCLNLNRISHPRILGVPSSGLKGRFTFVKTSEEFDPDKGWVNLKQPLERGIVPAIADQTVIQWGLGKKVGDTLIYKDEYGVEMPVKLIAGLDNSIFQGNILIDENIFLKRFPSNSGTHVMLIQSEEEDPENIKDQLERSLRNSGLEIEYAADRLAEFNSVENTYLSIFLLLGGLGMILGTVGLGLSLVRNIQDRQQEIAIMRATGYSRSSVLGILTIEHIILLGSGTLIGAVSAFVATVPSIFSDFIEASWQTATAITILILINGVAWIYFIGKMNLKKHILGALRSE